MLNNPQVVREEMVAWIQEYFLINGSNAKAVIGISGGKDSTVAAAACAEALGKDRVYGVLLPMGDQYDIGVSYEVCEHLGIPHVEINIQKPVCRIYDSLINNGFALNDAVTNNTPARVRMTTLYAVSGSVGGRVANTCNLSEDFIGWSTKFGDNAGDFSPLSKLTASEVKQVGRVFGLPGAFIDKIPEDGMCGFTDEEKFGFTYDELDRYIRHQPPDVKQEIIDRIRQMHQAGVHKKKSMPAYDPCVRWIG
jgi:NAD+ synthase